MTKTFAFAALATVSAFSMAPAAVAQDAGPSATVSFADINLTSEAGVEMLDSRIRRAAREVCGRPESNAAFGGPVRQCLRETIAAAQTTRNEVIAAARGETGERLAHSSFEIRRAS